MNNDHGICVSCLNATAYHVEPDFQGTCPICGDQVISETFLKIRDELQYLESIGK